MSDYRLLDEAEPKQLKPAWSPRTIFLFSVLGGPIGWVMAIVNCGRMGRPDWRRKTIAAIFMAIAAVVGLVWLSAGLSILDREIPRTLGRLTWIALAFYLLFTQRPPYEVHQQQGGGRASLLIPVILLILYAFFIWLVVVLD